MNVKHAGANIYTRCELNQYCRIFVVLHQIFVVTQYDFVGL